MSSFDGVADSEPTGPSWKFWALGGAVVMLVAGSAYLFAQVQSLRKGTAAVRESVVAEIAGFREANAVANQTSRRRIESLRQEVDAARRQAAAAAGQARLAAQSHAERLAKEAVDLQNKQQQQVLGELTDIRAVTTAVNLKLGEVSTDVTSVKSEVADTRTDLRKAVADLRRTIGDMGVMSGLIATNSSELAALRALGEREYVEFDIRKEKEPRRVGGVALKLKKTDPKRNKYTIELIADAARIEKKDRGINEPVQFYTTKTQQPNELVVNEVGKDQIRGYISAPKVRRLRELTELRR